MLEKQYRRTPNRGSQPVKLFREFSRFRGYWDILLSGVLETRMLTPRSWGQEEHCKLDLRKHLCEVVLVLGIRLLDPAMSKIRQTSALLYPSQDKTCCSLLIHGRRTRMYLLPLPNEANPRFASSFPSGDQSDITCCKPCNPFLPPLPNSQLSST